MPGKVARTAPTPQELAGRVIAGEAGAVARAITWCEHGGGRAASLLSALPIRAAPVLGLTGAPGSGKSTLVSALVRRHRENGGRVGVIAVDPSSPITGGALLGDRVRLDGLTPGDRDVFFRSLASRGASGGLSDAARGATRVLSAAGFDLIVVETVGAGQAEVRVMRVADTVAVVLIPGAGDEMQALKAGMMEIADVFILNKADLAGIPELRRHVKAMLMTRAKGGWRPPIVETVASRRDGIDDLLDAVAEHRGFLAAGTGAHRDLAGARAEVMRLARSAFDRALEAVEEEVLDTLDGDVDESVAAERLVHAAARRLAQ